MRNMYQISTEALTKIREIRKTLHENPEHSGNETVTKEIIKKFIIDNTNLEVFEYNGGLIAKYHAKGSSSRIAFRADFDAVSLVNGTAAHLCGHDGHTAALLGVALLISGIKCTIEIQDEFPATVNDFDCAQKVLDKCNGALLTEPMRWSEDFGHFLKRRCQTTGAFFGIGAGNIPDLHTKDYEYPDELLEYQVDAFINLLS